MCKRFRRSPRVTQLYGSRGRGGRAVANCFAKVLCAAGLPEGLLVITDESVTAAKRAIASGVDKVFFTGSAEAGKAVLRQLADTLTPCVVELSGCDAVFVMQSADLSRVTKAPGFRHEAERIGDVHGAAKNHPGRRGRRAASRVRKDAAECP